MSVVRCLIGIPGNMRFTDIFENDFDLSRAKYDMIYYKHRTRTLTELMFIKINISDRRKRVYVVKLDKPEYNFEQYNPENIIRDMSTNLDRTSSYLIYVVHCYDNGRVGLSHFPIDMLVNSPDLLASNMSIYLDDVCYN